MLLLLDNYEHLLAGVELLHQMLQAAPGLKLLVTSRERLYLHEEWLLPLAGLAVPPAPDLGGYDPTPAGSPTGQSGPGIDLETYAATCLFLHCARRLRPGFRPTPLEAAHIAHICRTLEGMPLAIELAAAWTRTLSCAQIAREMAGNLAFLATPLRNVPDRHRSMHAAFDHSWRLLDTRQQCLLRQLAVFRGGFTQEAAAAVAGASLTDLAGLVDACWLRVEPAGRYGMHELIRQYCTEKLAQDPLAADGEGSEQVRDRHGAYFGAFLQAQEQGYNWQRQAMAAITPEAGNVVAAWNWAVESGNVERIDQMGVSLFFIAEMEGWYHTVLAVFDAAIHRLRKQLGTGVEGSNHSRAMAPLLALLLFCQGHLYAHLGLLERARDCTEEGLAVLRDAPWSQQREERRTWLRYLLARVLSLEGDSAGAVRLLEALLTYVQGTDIPFWPYLPEIGTRFVQAHLYAALGQEAWIGGDYVGAERMVRRALTLREEMGEERFRAFNLGLLARILQTIGDYEQAEKVAWESLHLSQAFGDQIGVASAYLALGRVETALCRYACAHEHCQRSLDIARCTGNHSLLMGCLAGLGRIELARGNSAEAKRLFEEAVATFVALDTAHSNSVVGARLGLGWTALDMQEIPRAVQEFQQVLRATGRTAWETLDAITGLACTLCQAGQPTRAADLLAFVVEAPATADTTRKTAQESLQALETAIGPVLFAAATDLGRQRWMEDVVAALAADAEVALVGEGVSSYRSAEAVGGEPVQP
jgi:predicted ATPase